MLPARGLLPSLLLSWTPGQEEERPCGPFPGVRLRTQRSAQKATEPAGAGAGGARRGHCVVSGGRCVLPWYSRGGGPGTARDPPPDIGRAPLEVLVGSGALAGLRGAAVGKRKLAVSQVLSLNE